MVLEQICNLMRRDDICIIIPESCSFIGYIKLKWFCLDCKIYTGFLVLVHVIFQLSLAKLVESDNDESNKNIDKEKWEDNKEDNVEYALLCPEPGYWTFILIS